MDITIRKLSKRYGEAPVLTDFSAQFKEASIHAIMGPSGCGKTTLLRLLMGLERADSGEILGCALPLSAVFQENRLFEDFSVLSNLKAVLPRGADQDKPLAALHALGLTLAPSTAVRTLSGGMKRRVALARAMLAEAKLVLLDEPFTGLDTDSRRLALDFVRAHSAGKTVLLVTHDETDCAYLDAQLWRLGSA